jgi:hypothetical protein
MPDNSDGPQATTPASRLKLRSLAKGTDSRSVTRQHDSRRACRSAPVANASLYEPTPTRTWWWISLRCPHCGGSVHLGRVRHEADAAGPRRTTCGRKVWVVIRRVYRGHQASETAA